MEILRQSTYPSLMSCDIFTQIVEKEVNSINVIPSHFFFDKGFERGKFLLRFE